ncbi:MAG: ABC transporter ATP-binding protein [Spirochaetaceae bacterium]|nr:ABC transporter ATP-binding protein [Spirochaetaceae bacterium]
MDTIIKIDRASRFYNVGDITVKALENISLEIKKGEFTSIMGPSGSGKSTLMNLIGCLDSPSDGNIYIDGQPTFNMDEEDLAYLRNNKVGFIFQQFNLLSKLTALENVITPLLYSDVKKKDRVILAKEALRKVGLEDRMYHRPNEMSGGQKQRVAIARAIVTNPSIILADEPTGALDSKTGKQIMEVFWHLHEEGRTIIVVTHDIELGNQCLRQIHIKDGHLVEDKK